MEELITIAQAADLLGHSDPSNLHRAAREWLAWQAQLDAGQDAGPERGLRVRQVGPKTRLTTRPWAEEYRSRLRSGGYKRGEPKGQDRQQEV